MEFLRRTWANVSMDNLAFNYKQLRGHVASGTKFLGVVKGDAYGHGAVAISRYLEELGAEYLAVSNLEEAMQIRRAEVWLPILILGYTPPSFAVHEANYQIRQEVNDIDYARQLNAQLEGTGKRLHIHIKLDTGMSRIGFFAYNRPETIREILEISQMKNLYIEGIFQHFAVADSYDPADQEFTALQYRRYVAMLNELAACGLRPELRHCCNSPATVLHPEYAMDMIRPGICTYGYAPGPGMDHELELRPLLSWHTTVAQVRDFEEGISISYGRLWTTPGKRKIAVLPIGYADGLNRCLTNQLTFLLKGHEIRQVGRICMDMCMVDVTDVPDVRIDDEVMIMGGSHEKEYSCESIARKRGTITYEVTSDISKRVTRIYLEHGQEIGKMRYIYQEPR